MAGKKRNTLTPKQRKYCQGRVAGLNQKDAFVKAGFCPGAKEKTRIEAASRLENRPAIQAEIERLTAAADAGAILNRKQRQAILTEMALDDTRKDDARQRAIDMLNRMSGDYTDRVITDISGNVSLSLDDKRQMILDALKGND